MDTHLGWLGHHPHHLNTRSSLRNISWEAFAEAAPFLLRGLVRRTGLESGGKSKPTPKGREVNFQLVSPSHTLLINN